MKLYKSFLIIWTVWCLLQFSGTSQTSQAAKSNGTRISASDGMNQNKTPTSIPTNYDLCGVWPWMALIGYNSPQIPHTHFKCEAILISKQWVLAAAHCALYTFSFKPRFVRLGAVKIENTRVYTSEPNDFPIDVMIIHPEFSQTEKSNDLALIRLKVPVNYTENIRPICLLDEPKFKVINEYYKEKAVDIVGYAIQVEDRSIESLELRNWTPKILNQTECTRRYTKYTTDVSTDKKLICVKSTGSKDVCETTLGGVLLYQNVTERRYYLGGISSYGSDCFLGNSPDMFTVVPHFIDWIIQVTGEKFFNVLIRE